MPQLDPFLLFLRLVLGATFLYAGYRKLLMPTGRSLFTGLLRRIGFQHPAHFFAVAFGQVLAGMGLIFGAMTPIAALGMILICAFAMFYTTCRTAAQKAEGPLHYAYLLMMQCELPLILGLLALVVLGGGAYSLDALAIEALR